MYQFARLSRNENPMHSKSILIIEDTASIRDALQRYLQEEGYEVHCAKDGRDGYRLLLELLPNPPRLILLDLIMPTLNGMQFGTLLRHDVRFDDVLIVIMSGWPATETAKQIRADAILVKPFHPAALSAIAAKYCGAGAY